MYDAQRPGKPSQTKSNVSSWLKASRGSPHLCEPAAEYRYKPLKNREKRDSLHSLYDPEWTSVGAFLNKNRPLSSYHGYGSTNESQGKFVDRYCRQSRDSLDTTDEVVECALKLRPRRRQVIELQEFPLGYSKSFLNIDLESDPRVVFDPNRDQLRWKKKGRKFDRLTFSDSDLRQLSCTDKLDNYDSKSDLFGAPKPRKSSLKMATVRGKTNAKVVHFFPSNFSYDAQFVQAPTMKKHEADMGEFERRFNLSYCESRNAIFEGLVDEASDLAISKPIMIGGASELTTYTDGTRGIGNYSNNKTDSKEHAVDDDMKSLPIEENTNNGNFVQSRDCASSYVNYGRTSSTEDLTDSKHAITSHGSQSFYGNINIERKPTQNIEPMPCLADFYKSDEDFKTEPLAGLMSPARRAAYHQRERNTKQQNKIVTPRTAEALTAVHRSSPSAKSIDQTLVDRIGTTNQSKSELEKHLRNFEQKVML